MSLDISKDGQRSAGPGGHLSAPFAHLPKEAQKGFPSTRPEGVQVYTEYYSSPTGVPGATSGVLIARV